MSTASKWAMAWALGLPCAVLIGCGDDTDGGPEGSGGIAGSGSAGNGGAAVSESPISLETCLAYCEHYGQACNKPQQCQGFCAVARRAPDRCADQYNAFYGCGATSELDCQAQLGATPQVGCGFDEVVACLTKSDTACSRFDTFDPLCAKEHSELVAFLCPGEDDPGCVMLDPDSASRARCCPLP
jgi:hypothetical protein